MRLPRRALTPRPKTQLQIQLQDYPCPCRQPGNLRPIALTEALGCDRCPQIFALDSTQTQIILLTSPLPDPPRWIWNGHRWQPATVRGQVERIAIIILTLLMGTIIGLAFALNLSWGRTTLIWMFAVLTLAVLPAVLVWLASRR